jgi:hypothetical protein
MARAQIAASIAEVGIIEPPVIARDSEDKDRFHLLDGHLRLDILKARGETEVVCLIALDDEAFTYNKRVSRIAIIQEHKMILNAIRKGVSEERLARARCGRGREHHPGARPPHGTALVEEAPDAVEEARRVSRGRPGATCHNDGSPAREAGSRAA